MQHFLSADGLNKNEVEFIFATADEMKMWPRGASAQCSHGRLLGSLFFEPSTRTRWSTEAAMIRLGGQVLSMEYAKESSSDRKGEALRDTIQTCSQYVDVLVVRHPAEGSIQSAAPFSDCPIINGGDGTNEHPTQALLDLYTITRHFKNPKGLSVMFTGDLASSRTIHSLTKLLVPYEMNIITENYGPNLSAAPGKGIHCVYREQVYQQLPKIDILYMTRFQAERGKPNMSSFVLTNELAHTMKKDAIIMHPLPRTGELPFEVDVNPRAKYFEQAKNGMWVRMALLMKLLSA